MFNAHVGYLRCAPNVMGKEKYLQTWPGKGSNPRPSAQKSNTLLRRYKSGLYRKAVQVCTSLYPVTQGSTVGQWQLTHPVPAASTASFYPTVNQLQEGPGSESYPASLHRPNGPYWLIISLHSILANFLPWFMYFCYMLLCLVMRNRKAEAWSQDQIGILTIKGDPSDQTRWLSRHSTFSATKSMKFLCPF